MILIKDTTISEIVDFLDLADEHGKGGLLERRNFKTAGVVKITEINMDIEHKVKAGHHGWLKNFVRSVMNYSANRRKTPGDQIIMPFNQITKKENDK